MTAMKSRVTELAGRLQEVVELGQGANQDVHACANIEKARAQLDGVSGELLDLLPAQSQDSVMQSLDALRVACQQLRVEIGERGYPRILDPDPAVKASAEQTLSRVVEQASTTRKAARAGASELLRRSLDDAITDEMEEVLRTASLDPSRREAAAPIRTTIERLKRAGDSGDLLDAVVLRARLAEIDALPAQLAALGPPIDASIAAFLRALASSEGARLEMLQDPSVRSWIEQGGRGDSLRVIWRDGRSDG